MFLGTLDKLSKSSALSQKTKSKLQAIVNNYPAYRFSKRKQNQKKQDKENNDQKPMKKNSSIKSVFSFLFGSNKTQKSDKQVKIKESSQVQQSQNQFQVDQSAVDQSQD